MSKIDVLVVGAGPTGLMMAAEVARYGLKCRIIDKAPQASDKSKAIAIQARTLEIFNHLGIIDQFLDQGLKLRAGNPMNNGKILAHIDLSHINSPFPFVLSLEQNKTEKILENYLNTFDISVVRGVELISFEQNENGVEGKLLNHRSEKEEIIEARWMIGCDGAHSTIRKFLGLTFEGKVFSDVFSLADVHIDWNFSHNELFVFMESEGVMAVFPIPGKDRYRLIFQLPRCRNLLKLKSNHGLVDSTIIPDPTVEETQEMLDKYLKKKVKIRDPIWMANFHINSRLTNHYRKDHIFLAGDAAHIHSPVGGQGMNTGLQDAFNLGWKLAFVHQKKADPSLLNSFEEERHAIGKVLLDATEKASYAATLHNPIAIFVRNHLMKLLTKFSFFQKQITQAISQTGIHYAKSSIINEKGNFKGKLKVGCRAPNVSVYYKDELTDFYSLWKKQTCYHLLLFSPQVIPQPESNTQVIVVVKEKSQFSGKVVYDHTGDAHRLYDADQPTEYLIRPDLYIGFRQKKTSPI